MSRISLKILFEKLIDSVNYAWDNWPRERVSVGPVSSRFQVVTCVRSDVGVGFSRKSRFSRLYATTEVFRQYHL